MMSRRKLRREGRFIRERLHDPRTLKGMHFRTLTHGRHRLIMAFPRGPRRKGAGIVQAILHPLSEATGPDRKFLCKEHVCRRISEG